MEQTHVREVNPASYWGAIGSLLVFYCVGYFIFEGFVATMRSTVIIPMLIWFFIFLSIQHAFFGRIKAFLGNDKKIAATLIPHGKKEIGKMVFTLALFVPATLLALGYYPFEKEVTVWWAPLLFNAFCFLVATLISKTEVKSLEAASGAPRIIGLIVCSLFIALGLAYPNVRYIAGIMGLEAITFLIVSWLLEE